MSRRLDEYTNANKDMPFVLPPPTNPVPMDLHRTLPASVPSNPLSPQTAMPDAFSRKMRLENVRLSRWRRSSPIRSAVADFMLLLVLLSGLLAFAVTMYTFIAYYRFAHDVDRRVPAVLSAHTGNAFSELIVGTDSQIIMNAAEILFDVPVTFNGTINMASNATFRGEVRMQSSIVQDRLVSQGTAVVASAIVHNELLARDATVVQGNAVIHGSVNVSSFVECLNMVVLNLAFVDGSFFSAGDSSSPKQGLFYSSLDVLQGLLVLNQTLLGTSGWSAFQNVSFLAGNVNFQSPVTIWSYVDFYNLTVFNTNQFQIENSMLVTSSNVSVSVPVAINAPAFFRRSLILANSGMTWINSTLYVNQTVWLQGRVGVFGVFRSLASATVASPLIVAGSSTLFNGALVANGTLVQIQASTNTLVSLNSPLTSMAFLDIRSPALLSFAPLTAYSTMTINQSLIFSGPSMTTVNLYVTTGPVFILSGVSTKDVLVQQDLYVSNPVVNLTQYVSFLASSNLRTGASRVQLNVNGSTLVDGSTMISGTFASSAPLSVAGSTAFYAPVAALSPMSVIGGNASFLSTMVAYEEVSMLGPIVVLGPLEFNSLLNVTGPALFLDDLFFLNTTFFRQNLQVDGGIENMGILDVAGPLLQVAQNATFQQNLWIGGDWNSGVGGNIYVSGTTVFQSSLQVQKDLTVYGSLYQLGGFVLSGGDVRVRNAALFEAAGAGVAGGAVFSGPGAVNLSQSLTFTSQPPTFAGTGLVSGGTADFFAFTTVSNALVLDSNMVVYAQASFFGSLNLQTATAIQGSLTVLSLFNNTAQYMSTSGLYAVGLTVTNNMAVSRFSLLNSLVVNATSSMVFKAPVTINTPLLLISSATPVSFASGTLLSLTATNNYFSGAVYLSGTFVSVPGTMTISAGNTVAVSAIPLTFAGNLRTYDVMTVQSATSLQGPVTFASPVNVTGSLSSFTHFGTGGNTFTTNARFTFGGPTTVTSAVITVNAAASFQNGLSISSPGVAGSFSIQSPSTMTLTSATITLPTFNGDVTFDAPMTMNGPLSTSKPFNIDNNLLFTSARTMTTTTMCTFNFQGPVTFNNGAGGSTVVTIQSTQTASGSLDFHAYDSSGAQTLALTLRGWPVVLGSATTYAIGV